MQAIPTFPARRLEFTYDSAGRRLRKQVFAKDAATAHWAPVSDLRFLWDGWNLLAEFSVQQSAFSVLRSFTWGLDLSGTAQGAGGVGGLLSVAAPSSVVGPPSSDFFPAYDGNGNILALFDSATGERAAEYEYGPFGEPLRATGPAAANPFRFSTKYTDAETDLLYYGLRYYNPSTGRWLSRDPIAEKGGLNLYGFVGGNPVNNVDPLGLEFDNTGFYPKDEHSAGLIDYRPKPKPDCSSGFCVVGDTIQEWYGGLLETLGIEHVDITYNSRVIYVGKGGGIGRLGAEYKKTKSSYPLSKRTEGTMRYGEKGGCLKCKDATDADISDCLRKRTGSAGKNCQGDVQDATSDCCLSGFRTFVSTFFGWVD